jgi:diguanylate cyclase (GGDEF)-like protein
MDEYLEECGREVGFTFIDLDGLKRYNDNHGHSMGDELLKSFALVLSQQLPEDYKLFRVAGDEFAIVAHNLELASVEPHIQRAIHTVRNIGFEDIDASFGSAKLKEADVQSVSDMMKLADIRMYQNKIDRKKQSQAS